MQYKSRRAMAASHNRATEMEQASQAAALAGKS